MYSFNTNQRGQEGFTLIELLVSVGMFSILMTMIISALLTMVHTNRKGQALSLVVTNLNFALDSMTRNIRIGYDFNCEPIASPADPNCSSGGSVFGFTSSVDMDGDSLPGDNVVYRFNNNAIERSIDGSSWITLTGSDISIDTSISKFYVTGASPYPDSFQPKALIVIRATANVLGQSTTFDLQTSAVQRIPDN